MACQAAFPRYIGDDWVVGPITLYGNGTALDLTGCVVTGVFYAYGTANPVATLTVENSGVVLASDLTTGVVQQMTVPRAVTAGVKAQDRTATIFPTRLAVVVTDSQNKSRTYLLILFLPLDPRIDTPPAPPAST